MTSDHFFDSQMKNNMSQTTATKVYPPKEYNLFLFSLQATQSNIHGGPFLQKELAAKIHYFLHQAPP